MNAPSDDHGNQGYDLDYIWKQIDPALYDLLFGKRRAPDGTPLGKPPGGSSKAADVYSALAAIEPHATHERSGPKQNSSGPKTTADLHFHCGAKGI